MSKLLAFGLFIAFFFFNMATCGIVAEINGQQNYHWFAASFSSAILSTFITALLIKAQKKRNN
jgi:Na+-driven multidrug efflux pump